VRSWSTVGVRHKSGTPKPVRNHHARPLLHISQRSGLPCNPLKGTTETRKCPGGIVLWSRSFTPDAANLATSSVSPVNSLIREALIEGRTTEEKYEKDGYAVRWTFVNDLELIFVVCTQCRGPTVCLLDADLHRSLTNASCNSHTSKICSMHSRHSSFSFSGRFWQRL
jgi:hypothetical protein